MANVNFAMFYGMDDVDIEDVVIRESSADVFGWSEAMLDLSEPQEVALHLGDDGPLDFNNYQHDAWETALDDAYDRQFDLSRFGSRDLIFETGSDCPSRFHAVP